MILDFLAGQWLAFAHMEENRKIMFLQVLSTWLHVVYVNYMQDSVVWIYQCQSIMQEPTIEQEILRVHNFTESTG